MIEKKIEQAIDNELASVPLSLSLYDTHIDMRAYASIECHLGKEEEHQKVGAD
jgi:hypothetical protein